jgi:hypothetical protein
MDYQPNNSNYGNRIEIPLLEIGPEYAGETIFISSFDADAGSMPPVDFYFDTIYKNDWQYSFPVHTQPQPDGVVGRNCSPGNCNNKFITPAYIIQLPGDLSNCDWLNPDPANCTPFYGGRFMASYDGGAGDTYGWLADVPELPLHDITVGCSAFPIGIYNSVPSLTAANYPTNFDYPSMPPEYDDFIFNVGDVPLSEAQPGYIFAPSFDTESGWLVWNTGISANASTLANSLSWPGDSTDYADHGDAGQVLPGFSHVVRGYVHPLDSTDTAMHLGDWVAASTGSLASMAPCSASSPALVPRDP